MTKNLINQPKDDKKNDIYTFNTKFVKILISSSLFSLLLGFFFNFSPRKKIIFYIEKVIKSNRKCPGNFEKIDLGGFLTSFSLHKINIDRKCLNTSTPLILEQVKIKLGLPSLVPLGIKASAQISDKYSKIDLSAIYGIKNHHFKLKSKKIQGSSLRPFLKNIKLDGSFSIESNGQVSVRKLENINLFIKSKDLSLPSQTIKNFIFPTMKINSFSLKAQMKKNKELLIKELILGDTNSPIRAKITGNISLNMFSFSNSKLNLSASFKISKSIFEELPILKLFLSLDKQDKQGFYNSKILGTISSPSHTFK